MDSKNYGRPDSVVFLDKRTAKFKNEEGYVYFFKYRQKKDDPIWKIGTAGLVSKNPQQFEIDDTIVARRNVLSRNGYLPSDQSYNFTSFTDTKLTEQSLSDQLDKELKIMLCSRRKSAKEFYNVGRTGLDDILRIRN